LKNASFPLSKGCFSGQFSDTLRTMSEHIPFYYDDSQSLKPKVLISSCLQGEAVRYDGASKPMALLQQLQQQLELVSICPEVGAGLPTPRPPIQLVETPTGLIARGRDDLSIDATDALDRFRRQSLEQWQNDSIVAYIFKSRSPSCGLGSTPLFDEQGNQQGVGDGIQAAWFRARMPWLALCEEEDLASSSRCRQFVELCQRLAEAQRAERQGDTDALIEHYRDQGIELPRELTAITQYLQQRIFKQT